jgi:hypothetical protein
MVLPPSVGAVHVTLTEPLPRVTVGLAGALGRVAGVTGVDVGDADPVPTEFLATTVNV